MNPFKFIFISLVIGVTFVSSLWAQGETVIKGGKMELINKGAEVVFTNGVKMEQGADVLTAKEMRTSSNRDKITASGDVKLSRKVSSTETWKGSGEKGFYDANAGTGYLLGGKKRASINKIDVLTATSTRTMEIWGDRIDFSQDPKMTKATGHVQGKTTDPQTKDIYEFFSQKAVYDANVKILVLSGEGSSRMIQMGSAGRKEVTGRVITYYVDSGRLVSDGEAQAVMESVSKEKN